jgi:hypothetical protein
MKARVFIGSSSERLDVAYAIQQSLEHDCNPTVWTQGIFQLSNNSLDDLLNALNQFDFGIFIFTADDISKIRGIDYNAVRDNVIFELGLFIGRLGKERVYFVVPRNSEGLHLPTDLLGVTPGLYDDKRDDNNLLAALGPFCNQVRARLKEFVYENLNDLASETKEVKNLAINKPPYWEYLLAAELLEPKLRKINDSYAELERGLIYIKSRGIDNPDEFSKWFQTALQDIVNLITVFSACATEELKQSFGDPGVPGNVIEIKTVTDKLVAISKELLSWEHNLHSIHADEKLMSIISLMKGWTKKIFIEIAKVPSELKTLVKLHQAGKDYLMNLTIPPPDNVDEIIETLEDYYAGY